MKKLVLTVMSLCLAVTMWGQTPAGSEWSPQVKQAATMIKENPAKASEDQKVLAIQKELEEATALELPMMEQKLPNMHSALKM